MNLSDLPEHIHCDAVDFSDDNIIFADEDHRSPGILLKRPYNPLYQHAIDRKLYKLAVELINEICPKNVAKVRISLLNECKWVKEKDLEDSYEFIGSIQVIETRRPSYSCAYSSDFIKEYHLFEDGRYGNTSKLGKFLPNTGNIYEIAKYKIDGKNIFYIKQISKRPDPNQPAIPLIQEFRVLDPDYDSIELVKLAYTYL